MLLITGLLGLVFICVLLIPFLIAATELDELCGLVAGMSFVLVIAASCICLLLWFLSFGITFPIWRKHDSISAKLVLACRGSPSVSFRATIVHPKVLAFCKSRGKKLVPTHNLDS